MRNGTAVVSRHVHGLIELTLGRATTSTDHLYVHPQGAGDLIVVQLDQPLGVGEIFIVVLGPRMRFQPTLGAQSRDRPPASMARIALAPWSPDSVCTDLIF